MAQNWKKVFSRINWINRPSTATPLGATNLNAGDYAINELDNRVLTLDTVKADMSVVNEMVANVSLNDKTGVITVTYKNGSSIDYDTNLEKIAVNFSYDYTNQRLVLALSDGSTQYVDMSALITQYEFKDSATIAFSVDSTGKISASVKSGSITDAMLESGYLNKIKIESAKAESASEQAQSSETASDYNAKLAQSYSIGGSGIRDGEDTDNAKYYNEQASVSALLASKSASSAESAKQSASASATSASNSTSSASTSATNAKASETASATSATNAKKSETNAVSSASSASESASSARTSASNASTSEANAKKYYEQAKSISESFSGALRPMGTVAFANLPSVSSASAGDMYNISDEFVTTSDFVEGAGHTEPAGSNVYKLESGKWDVLAGSPVTGVKGANETSFRRGNVNITCDNIGALATNGDSKSVITTFTSNDSATGDSTPPTLLTSGETHASIFSKVSTIFKNVRWLLSKMGTTDLSSIGDGTVTNAIGVLNSNLYQLETKAITTDNIAQQSVSSSATANAIRSGGKEGTAMTFSYSAPGANPTYVWGTHSGVNSQYVYTPTRVVQAGKGIISEDGTYYKVSGLYTFKDTNNALIVGTKGNYIFGISALSDRRLKKNIKDSSVSGLDKINSIQMHSFDFVDDKYGDSQDIGYIAQELVEVVPECVIDVPQDKDEFGYDSSLQINDTPLIKYLVKAVQELSNEVEELKKVY